MAYYKIVIQETYSFTVYIKAKDEENAKHRAIYEDIDSYNNQDFDQEVIKIKELKTGEIPIYRTINE